MFNPKEQNIGKALRITALSLMLFAAACASKNNTNDTLTLAPQPTSTTDIATSTPEPGNEVTIKIHANSIPQEAGIRRLESRGNIFIMRSNAYEVFSEAIGLMRQKGCYIKEIKPITNNNLATMTLITVANGESCLPEAR